MRRRSAWWGVVAAALGVTCAEPMAFEAVAPASVTVTRFVTSPVVGTTLVEPLAALVTDQRGRPLPGVEVTFAVTRGTLGAARGVTDRVGRATTMWTVDTLAAPHVATATVAGATTLQDTASVAVQAGPVAGFTLSQATLSFTALDDTTALTLANARDRYGNAVALPTVRWEVADTSIASVSATGVVRARAPGRTSVRAVSATRTEVATVDVAPVVTALSVSPTRTRVVTVGELVPVTVTARDRNSRVVPAGSVVVRSSDPGVVAVPDSSVPVVRTVGNGDAVVTVARGTVSASLVIRVGPAIPTRVVASVDSVVVGSSGRTVSLSAVVFDQDSLALGGVAPTWVSLDTAVATVSGASATSRRAGVARLVGTAGSVADTVRLVVQQVPARLVVTTGAANLDVGDTVRVPAVAYDSADAVITAPGLTYESAAPATAGVTTAGVVTGLALGTTAVTVRAGSLSVVFSITVRTLVKWRELANGRNGRFTCGISTTDDLYCWGTNFYGHLGIAAPGDRLTPTRVAIGEKVRDVAPGNDGACAVTISGSLYCWGGVWMLTQGAANGTPIANCAGCFFLSTPRRIPATALFVSVASAQTFACALTAAGEAYCWGDNRVGQAGIPALTAADSLIPEPRQVPTALRFTRLMAGAGRSVCGRSTSGGWYCWGANDSNVTLGNPPVFYGAVPGPALAASEPLVDVSWGTAFNPRGGCGLTTDGRAFCWGGNTAGQIGDGTWGTPYSNVPRPAGGALRFRQILSGQSNTCGLGRDSTVYCWGLANNGILGTPSAGVIDCSLQATTGFEFPTSNYQCDPVPRPVPGLPKIAKLANNPDFAAVFGPNGSPTIEGTVCAIDYAGVGWCWGNGPTGNLTVGRTPPVRIASP